MANGEIKVVVQDTVGLDSEYYIYKILLNDYRTCYLYNSPFANCQIFTIGRFNKILFTLMDDNYGYDLIVPLVNKIQKVCGIEKTLLTVDIEATWYPRIKSYIEDRIVKVTEYVNFTGNRMVMLMIDVRESK